MGYATDLVRVALKWVPNQTDWPSEVAVNTFWMQLRADPGSEPFAWGVEVTTLADRVASKLASHWSTTAALHGSGYQIREIKVAHIDGAGHTLDEGVHAVGGGTLAGTTSGGICPPEVAVCLSLYGYPDGSFVAQRGRKRGRIYLPYIALAQLSATGKLSSSGQDLALAWSNFFSDIDGVRAGAADAYRFDLVVASRAGAIATHVDHLAVDDHLDTQRRRAHQSPAVRQTVVLAS